METTGALGGQIERSLSKGIDSLSGCGTGTLLLFMLLLMAIGMIVYLTKRNTATVQMVLNALLKKEDPDEETP